MCVAVTVVGDLCVCHFGCRPTMCVSVWLETHVHGTVGLETYVSRCGTVGLETYVCGTVGLETHVCGTVARKNDLFVQ